MPTIPASVTQSQVNAAFQAIKAQHPDIHLPAPSLEVLGEVVLNQSVLIELLITGMAHMQVTIDQHTQTINDLHEALSGTGITHE